MTTPASATFGSSTAASLLAVVLLVAAPAAASEKGVLHSEAALAYASALATLSDGDAEQALEELVAAEATLAPDGTDEEIERLKAGQTAIGRRLSLAASETLVPVIVLHESAYLQHLTEGRLRLAVRSRRFAVDLTELFVAQSRRPDTDRLASSLLTSLGGYLQQSTMDTAATALYHRALELDPFNGTARLGLASLPERQGKYGEALDHVDALLRQGSRYPPAQRREARLRQGVNLLRLGRTEEGRTALEVLLVGPERDWILSLAYQELARQASAEGHHNAARRLLTEAVARLPDDASLAVQLAYAVDRTGGRALSADLRRTLEDTATVAGPSPRAQYASSSGAALSDLRRHNDGIARGRLQLLGDALDRLSVGGGGP